MLSIVISYPRWRLKTLQAREANGARTGMSFSIFSIVDRDIWASEDNWAIVKPALIRSLSNSVITTTPFIKLLSHDYSNTQPTGDQCKCILMRRTLDISPLLLHTVNTWKCVFLYLLVIAWSNWIDDEASVNRLVVSMQCIPSYALKAVAVVNGIRTGREVVLYWPL